MTRPDREALAHALVEAMRANAWVVPPSFGWFVADRVLAEASLWPAPVVDVEALARAIWLSKPGHEFRDADDWEAARRATEVGILRSVAEAEFTASRLIESGLLVSRAVVEAEQRERDAQIREAEATRWRLVLLGDTEKGTS